MSFDSLKTFEDFKKIFFRDSENAKEKFDEKIRKIQDDDDEEKGWILEMLEKLCETKIDIEDWKNIRSVRKRQL